MLKDSIIALIRTAVPALVGWVIARLAAYGLELDAETQAQLIAVCLLLATTGYYALVTFLERKVHPGFGWLLGYAKAPSYVPQEPNTPATPGDQLSSNVRTLATPSATTDFRPRDDAGLSEVGIIIVAVLASVAVVVLLLFVFKP